MEVAERKEENQLIDKLVRNLSARIETPVFMPGGVPVRGGRRVW